MEHREPPRASASERRFGGAALDPAETFPLRTFEPGTEAPRAHWYRTGLLAVVGLAIAGSLIFLASQAALTAVAWLHHQPQYLVPFGDIHLVTQPPVCYRGGSAAFLERVRKSAGEPEQISLLEKTPDRLARAFKIDPWVEKVERVTYSPGRISVALEYREPAAVVYLQDGQQQVIDDEGRILPVDDLDLESLERPVKITGEELAAPADSRAGVVWKRKGSGGAMDEADARIVAAARLAGFLRRRDRAREAQDSPALRVIEIIVSNQKAFPLVGLFVLNDQNAEICWGEAPGAEQPGQPTADDKWRMLADWREPADSRSLAAGDYWRFARNGLRQVCPHPQSPHRPGKKIDGPSGAATERAKESGSG
jgi:hypothetical protein